MGYTSEPMFSAFVPEGIDRLASLREYSKDGLRFSIQEQDSAVEGNGADHLWNYGGDGSSMSRVLNSLDWWIHVSKALAFGRGDKYADPEFKEQIEKMLSLLNDVLTSYTAALAETLHFIGDGDDKPGPFMELIKRYRLYTRYLCTFAQELWPKVDLEWLLNHR